MLYLNKLLSGIEKDSQLFKSKDLISVLGISSTQIKDLKKFAIEQELIKTSKDRAELTSKGIDYLLKNPIKSWCSKDFPLRPEVNLEYLKEEKTPSILTKAIRNFAKHLLEGQELKTPSIEFALYNDAKKFNKLISEFEKDILNNKRNNLEKIYNKYIDKGLSKSIISIVLLLVIKNNTNRIAIYEKAQFQLKFDTLMFDRIIACPQNFELQETVMQDMPILKDISNIILHETSNNILDITKGLIKSIRKLDKYTMNTQNLDKHTLRFRNVIVNAKDPISLFERDIPKSLGCNSLSDCDREFLNNLEKSLNKLNNCTNNLIVEIKSFLFESFQTKSKESLRERFIKVKEFIGEKELRVLLNNVVEIDVTDDLWINRIATFINKFRVPKDWTDDDYADFKIKTKELALKFFVLEATIGTNSSCVSNKYQKVLDNYLKLTKQEQMVFLRKIVDY